MGGVIDAVERLRADTPGLSLVVVGDGPDRAQLEAYARARLTEGYVFTGALPHAEALAVIKDAELFVLNSTYEGLSHLLIEALSLGAVTVATDVGGNPELIKHEENGLLVPVREPEKLAEACQRALTDDSLRTKLSAAAFASMEHFSMDVMTRRTAELIHSIP
jgi:glycosyltransferase involved in cell wall biosynthesis